MRVQADSTSTSALDLASSAFPVVGHGVSPMTSDVGNVSGVGSSSQIPMPSVIRPDDNFFQHHLSSSLLWPDSAELFQSLMSADGVNWAQPMPGVSLAPEIIPGPESASENGSVNQTGGNELTVAEDGHRAVQTINGLLTKTVRSREQPFMGAVFRCRFLCLTYMSQWDARLTRKMARAAIQCHLSCRAVWLDRTISRQ